jgi:lipoprotein-anchoring transpeptidase ErfK/SrfK
VQVTRHEGRTLAAAALFFLLVVTSALALACVEPTVSDLPAAGAPTSPTPDAPRVAQASATAAPPTLTPIPRPDRASCAEIRGTQYHSPAERDWYLINCRATPVPTPTILGATPVPTSTISAPSPPSVSPREVRGERWILIDIADQTASAMVGETPIYTALVTTGKEGWETPRGTFRVVYRVENETMTSDSIGAEEHYVLENVLYTQYFTSEGHALHLNYWRPDYYFGNIPSSHGCVGMRLADAEFFWSFASHGTRVTIR